METLNIGSSGPLVGYLQQILKELGYYDGKVTYKYDTATANSVKAAQRFVGVTADGIIGKRTWDAFAPFFSGNYNYEIKSGDTFWSIAVRTGIDLKLLLAANPLYAPENLAVGQTILIPYRERIIPDDIKYSYEIMMLNLKALAERYPFLTTGVAGYSVLGKEIPSVRLGRGEKTVMYNASHHANEWINSLLMMKFIEEFCLAYVLEQKPGGYDVDAIFSRASIYVMPMVNPDGVDLVTGALSEQSPAYEYAYSLRRSGIPFPNGWKANIIGTDLNLNYPAGWENAKRIKAAQGVTSPGPRDYVGPYPFSVPESRAAAQMTINLSPLLTLAYHSAGEIIYWKYLDYNPPRSYAIAQEFGKLSGYAVEITPISSGYAGYKDWYIQEYDRPGYTVETGTGGAPIPLSQFSKIYNDNLGILFSAPLLI